MKFHLLILFATLSIPLFGQSEKTSLWIESIRHDGNAGLAQMLTKCEAQIMKAFVGHGAFSVVDRNFTSLIEQEKELQKAESFIDGKIVAQGKSVGAEYIIAGTYSSKTRMMELVAVSVANENVVARQEQKVDFTAPAKYYYKQIQKIAYKMANELAGSDRAKVVRSLEDKGGQSKLLLIAGGSAKGFQKGLLLDIFSLETIDVEGTTLERYINIGSAKIERVENANFCNAKVKDGGKEIYRLLNAGKTTYATINRK